MDTYAEWEKTHETVLLKCAKDEYTKHQMQLSYISGKLAMADMIYDLISEFRTKLSDELLALVGEGEHEQA